MKSHRLILINLVIPPINPVPRDRSNIGELSGSRYISLISGDIVSLSYGLQLCKMDGQQNLCHPRIFSRHIIFTIRKMSLGICYYDNVLLWRSDDGGGDLHFLPVTKISVHEKTIPSIWDHCFSKRTGNVQPLVNISEINLKKLFRHVTANA